MKSNFRKLGSTSIELSPIGLGGMSLSYPNAIDYNKAILVISKAIELGINFIDTANVYCPNVAEIGHNEKLIAKAISLVNTKDEIIVATKGGVDKIHSQINGSPKFLRKSCVESLYNLNVDCIPLYQLHVPDNAVPLEDSIGELSRLKEEGKILHIGLCNVSHHEINIASSITRIESVQNVCNPMQPEDYTNGILELCNEKEMTFIPHSTFGGKNYYKRLSQANVFKKLSQHYNATPFEIILSWHLNKSKFVLPIPGATTISSVKSSIKASSLELNKVHYSVIDSLLN